LGALDPGGERHRGGSGLEEAAVATDFGGGVQEDLDLGVGEDGGSDVAALHDDSARGAECALLIDHPGPELGVDGYLRCRGCDVRVADTAGDIAPVEEDAIAFHERLQGDACISGEVEEGVFFVEGEIAFDGLEGEGAIHGAGFEIEEAKAAGEMGGEGALPCPCGAVDGNYGTFTPLRCVVLLQGLPASKGIPRGYLFSLKS
jgi:hypothetical protein